MPTGMQLSTISVHAGGFHITIALSNRTYGTISLQSIMTKLNKTDYNKLCRTQQISPHAGAATWWV